jgi:putative endonuclease
MGYTGYILRSQVDGSYYVGQSKDVQKRLARHNRGDMIATRHARPWELVFAMEFPSRAEAMQWECQVKAHKSRRYLESLIGRRSAGR